MKRAIVFFALTTASCVGVLGDEGPSPGDPPIDPGLPGRDSALVSTMRRLTAHEYDNALRDLFQDTAHTSSQLLPTDVRNPFDNDYTTQAVSSTLVEGVESLAGNAVASLLADVVRRDEVLGCKGASPSDTACLTQIVRTMGRRALRRPLFDEETGRYLALQSLAQQSGDFYIAVDTFLRALLIHPEFLYRIEVGTEVTPGLYQLNQFEVASRLSFFLWGSIPSDALLDSAQAGKLGTTAEVRAAATAMLEDPRARDQWDRFHALWLGYETLPVAIPAQLQSAMKDETDSLINHIVFDQKRPWYDLFRSTETFVSDDLATHYGLPAPGSATPVLVSYGSSGRKGILSHGTFLSTGYKFADTSPTRRGKAIRQNLFCQPVPAPPVNVDADVEPTSPKSSCKVDRYSAHREKQECAGCHSATDPIGFGLEQYDIQGRRRGNENTYDSTKPDCPIDGKGELVGVGEFNGPAELGELMIESGSLNGCAVRQLHRFLVGRPGLDGADDAVIEAFSKRIEGKPFRFDELVVDFVSSEEFLYRRESK